MKKKKRFRRLKLVLFGVILLAALVGLLPGILISGLGPDLVAKRLAVALQSPVQVESVSGGWFEPLSIGGIVVRDGGPQAPEVISLRDLRVHANLSDLLFGSGRVRVTVEGLLLDLAPDREGRSKGGALLRRLLAAPRSPEPEGGQQPFSLPRGVALEITDARIVLEAQHEGLLADVNASWSGAEGDPLSLLFTVGAETQPDLALRASAAGLFGPGEPEGECELTLRAFGLDAWGPLLEALEVWRPGGTIRTGRLYARTGAEGEEDLLELDLSLDELGGLGTPGVGRDLGNASVAARVSRQGRQITVQDLSVRAGGGELSLPRPARLDLSGTEPRCEFALNATMPHSDQLSELLRGVLPEGCATRGMLKLDAAGSGRLPFSRGADGVFQGFSGTLTARLEALDVSGNELDDLDVSAAVRDGGLDLRHLRVGVASGRMQLAGRLTDDAGDLAGSLAWSVLAPLVLKRSASDGLGLDCVVTGSGALRPRVSRGTGFFSISGQLAATTMSLLIEGEPQRLFLGDARAGFRVDVDVSTSRATIPNLALTSRQLGLVLQKASLDWSGPAPRLSGSLRGAATTEVARWLAPDSGIEPGRVRFEEGSLDLSLGEDLLTRSRASIKIRCDRAAVRGELLTGLALDVGLKDGRVDLASASGELDEGRIEANGSFAAVAPAPGDVVRVALQAVQLEHLLALGGHPAGASGIRSGLLSGSLSAKRSEGSYGVDADLAFRDLSLGAPGVAPARLARVQLVGGGIVADDGSWNVGILNLKGTDLSGQISRTSLRTGADGLRTLTVDARLQSATRWLMPFIGDSLPDELTLEGDTRLNLRGELLLDRPADSPQLAFGFSQSMLRYGPEFQGVCEVEGRLEKGRLHLAKASVAGPKERVNLWGQIAAGETARNAGDVLRARLGQVPLVLRETLPGEAGDRVLESRLRASGSLDISTDAGKRLAWKADLRTSALTRRLLRAGRTIGRATLPALKIESGGVLEGPVEKPRSISGDSLTVTGNGLTLRASGLGLERTGAATRLAARLDARTDQAVTQALLLGRQEGSLRVLGGAHLVGDGSLVLLDEGTISWKRATGAGSVQVASYELMGLPGKDLQSAFELKDGAFVLAETTRTSLSGGTFVLRTPGRVTLGGDSLPFALDMKLQNVDLAGTRDRHLGVVNPLFTTSADKQGAGMFGKLSLDVKLDGSWSAKPGWSRSVNGRVKLGLVEGKVVGSSLLSLMGAKVPALLPGAASALLGRLGAQGGGPGKFLTALSGDGFKFNDVDMDFAVNRGTLQSQKNIVLQSPQVNFTIAGRGGLEGDVDFRVRSDLLQRMLKGWLPTGEGGIGGILGGLGPLGILKGLEIGALVTGNVLASRPDGSSAVDVKVTVNP